MNIDIPLLRLFGDITTRNIKILYKIMKICAIMKAELLAMINDNNIILNYDISFCCNVAFEPDQVFIKNRSQFSIILLVSI